MSDAEWIEGNAERIGRMLTDLEFPANAPLRKDQARIRDKCLADARFHLYYLTEALRSDSQKLFIDYAGWAKQVLGSRNIPEEHLREHLRNLGRVLQQEMPGEASERPLRFIHAAVEELPSLPAAMASYIDPANPYAQIANAYLTALLQLDLHGAVDTLICQVQEKGLSIADLFEHVISPAQREVGRLWQHNFISVLQEHYCTAATEVVLTRLSRSFSGSWRQVRALNLCAAGEQHCLGLKMFSELLEADGWAVSYIGQNTPSSAVLEFLRRFPTDLVSISIGTAMNLSSARSLVNEIREADLPHTPRILVGGAVLTRHPDLWRTLQADAWALSVTEGLEAANRLVNVR